MTEYKNNTVLITGASSGIGLALVHELVAKGAAVILVARSTDTLNGIAKNIENAGGIAHVFTSDLSVPGSAQVLYTQIKDAGLEVDLLINNAGYGRWGEFTEFDRGDYASMIQLNIVSLTELCHLVLPDMTSREQGGIINVASTAAFFAVPYGSVYASTKSYVLTFTEALRYEYQQKGIAIMALCPGATESKFMDVATVRSEQARKNTEKSAGKMTYQTSEEVARECLVGYAKNKQYVISGRSNRLMIGLARHLPRSVLLTFVGKMFKDLVGK